jgi:uncharacterized lipoprotein
MIRFFAFAVISSTLLFTGLLTGCSYFSKGKNAIMPNKDKLYMQNAETPPLRMPAGIPANSVGDTYAIPAVSGGLSKKQPSLLPPGSLADQIAQGKVSADVLKQKPAIPKQTVKAKL